MEGGGIRDWTEIKRQNDRGGRRGRVKSGGREGSSVKCEDRKIQAQQSSSGSISRT